MSEEKRYYADCDGSIAEFPAGLLYWQSGATQYLAASETSYVFNEQKIPAWLAEAAIAHWKLLREHPDAERKLRCDKALGDNRWYVKMFDDGTFGVMYLDTTPVTPVSGGRYFGRTGCRTFPTPLAAIEAALAATEKKPELPAAKWPKWFVASDQRDAIGLRRCDDVTSAAVKYDKHGNALSDGCGTLNYHGYTALLGRYWGPITTAEAEAILAEARAKSVKQPSLGPCGCCQAELPGVSVTISGVPELSANYIRMDIVRQTIDKIGDAVRELGEKVAGGKK